QVVPLYCRPILRTPAAPDTGRPNDARSPAALPAACAAESIFDDDPMQHVRRWMSCSFMYALIAAPLTTTNSLPLLVRAVLDRSTNSSSRSVMRSQHPSTNDRMTIRRSLFGAQQPIRCSYSAAKTKSARLSRSHIANCTSL